MPLGKYWRSSPLKFSFNPRSPAVIRFSEIAVTGQRLIDGLVAVELTAVIVGDSMCHVFEVRQQVSDGPAGQGGGFTGYRAGQVELATALYQR